MTNKEKLQQKILGYLQISTMSDKEKSMWTLLLPTLNDKETQKLHDILEKEINSLMELSAQ